MGGERRRKKEAHAKTRRREEGWKNLGDPPNGGRVLRDEVFFIRST